MAAVQGEADALDSVGRERTGRRLTSEGGRGRTAPAPDSGWRRAVSNLAASVWAPVLGKLAAILCGMLALAAIGASSIARSGGAELPSALPAASFRAGGMGSFLGQSAGAHDAGASPDPKAPEPPEPPRSAGLTEDGKVILNQADMSDLRKLGGVGPKRAQLILDLRAKLGGRFKKLSDLLRVKGIGPKTLAKWKDKLVLDAPKVVEDAGAK
jgi:competence protein ComEA